MDIRVLRYFLAVAREESITKAAETLHMTQPPLSRQLKDLENEVGKQLLIRGSRKVTLTEDGMLLKRRAQEIIELADKAQQELSHKTEELSGEVSFGCAETRNMTFLCAAPYPLPEDYRILLRNW